MLTEIDVSPLSLSNILSRSKFLKFTALVKVLTFLNPMVLEYLIISAYSLFKKNSPLIGVKFNLENPRFFAWYAQLLNFFSSIISFGLSLIR